MTRPDSTIDPTLPGIALYGHLSDPIGFGSAGRGLAAAIAASGLPHRIVDVPLPAPGARRRPIPHPAELGMAVGLVATNPNVLRRFLDDGLQPSAGHRTYMIGYWSWETRSGLPDEWGPLARLFDEIWAPSAFGAACLAPFLGIPVLPMSPAVDRISTDVPKAPSAPFTFLCVFDAYSNLDRKNPTATIAAYRTAFPQASAGVRLVLKTRGLRDQDRAILERAIGGRGDIELLDRSMAGDEIEALMLRADCIVSLHRSEAFGHVMSEAMAAGRPVIATDYSGNLDFMTPATAWLVPYELSALRRDSPPFRQGTVWADPSLRGAAQAMRYVHGHRDEAGAKAARGAAAIRAQLSPARTGARIAARIALLRDSGRLTSAIPSPAVVAGARPSPSILVATPVKNAARYLDRYFGLLGRLRFPPDRTSVALLESDSTDGTWDRLQLRRDALSARYRRLVLARHDYGYRLPPGPRYQAAAQLGRRGILARSRNRLLQTALRDEDWVLWLDVDLEDYPADLVDRLLAASADIVVPHCVLPNGRTYDRNTFVLAIGADGSPVEDARNVRDGLCLPDAALGRRHLQDFPVDGGPVEVHGVGGSALLIRADLHRDGLIFPVAPYRGYLETEGLAAMARDMGHRCIGLPDLRVVHPPI